MRRRRNVKVIATLGPASATRERIAELFAAGADIFRINMSHATHDAMRERIQMIRSIEQEQGRPIGILVDLQGPKLRIGDILDGAMMLENGQRFALDLDTSPGNAERVPLPHREILKVLKPGAALLVDDGKLRLRVVEAAPERAVVTVEVGGKLSSKKGVNVPDAVLPIAALSAKDRADLDAGLSAGADWIALSFVQRPEDVAEARRAVAGRAGVLAKIEKPSAVDRLDEILELADAVMVARGDLGVELPLEQVPGKQKQIIRRCRRAGKPVIVATQMLESMIAAPVPTRAEASDVATAVFEGADAIMLSAESASGAYPVEAVTMMDRIARSVEGDPHYRGIIEAQRDAPEHSAPDAIMAAARQVAETLNAAAIVSFTSSGSTGLRAARERPGVPVIALTPVARTGRRLALAWGLHCVVTEDAHDLDDMVDRACRIAYREGFAAAGQRIVITAGVPLGTPGATNLLRIAMVGRNETAALD
mgnify:CR=1 FL=1